MLEESAVLTAASGPEQTGPRVYTFDPYLLGGTPFTTSVPCPVLKKNVAIGVFVRTRGNEIEVDFGQRTYSFSKAAAERGRVTEADDAARFHAMWLSNKPRCADVADGASDDSDGDSRTTEGNGVRGASATVTGSTPNATSAPVGATSIRPVLPIAFRCLVPVPINTKAGVRLWLAEDGVEATVRRWVLATMRGRGLERRVATGEVDRAGHDVRDAMIVTTEALVAELLTALRPCVWSDGRSAPRELLDGKHLRKGLQRSSRKPARTGSALCAAPVRTPNRSPPRSVRPAGCRAAALFTSHLRQSCTAIETCLHSAFQGLSTVGACVDALLRMPAEDRSAPGLRSEAGAQRASATCARRSQLGLCRVGAHERGGARAGRGAVPADRDCVAAGAGTEERGGGRHGPKCELECSPAAAGCDPGLRGGWPAHPALLAALCDRV